MHFTDGHVVEHSEPGPFDNIFGWVGTSTRRVGVFRRVFPWGDNKLEEAWMELRFPGHVFWLAVPYGFTRNPLQKLCASSDGGIPEFAPAMEPLGENAKIVNWKRVEYDLGAIQNDWSLRLLQSNPTDGCSELALYRGDSDVEKKMPLWDVHSPRTIVWIESSGSVVQKCRAVSSQLQGDRIRRDLFKINHNPTNGELRDWGKIVIKVDDKSYAAILPSSLFRCFHGHTTWDPRSVLRSSTAQ